MRGPTKPDAIELFLDLERWTLARPGQKIRGQIFTTMHHRRQIALTARWESAGWLECGSLPAGWLTAEGLRVAREIRERIGG